jgi:anti-sigma factor RsiW
MPPATTSPHLTERQISELLIGGARPGQEAHLENCPACAEELANLRGVLSQFRGSVRQWSEDQMGAEFEIRPGRRAHPYLVPAIALALLLLLGIGVSRVLTISPGGTPAVPVVAEAESDAALLDEIRIDVERPIPGDMAPLLASYETPFPKRASR